jgi:hypothetical protein
VSLKTPDCISAESLRQLLEQIHDCEQILWNWLSLNQTDFLPADSSFINYTRMAAMIMKTPLTIEAMFSLEADPKYQSQI